VPGPGGRATPDRPRSPEGAGTRNSARRSHMAEASLYLFKTARRPRYRKENLDLLVWWRIGALGA